MIVKRLDGYDYHRSHCCGLLLESRGRRRNRRHRQTKSSATPIHLVTMAMARVLKTAAGWWRTRPQYIRTSVLKMEKLFIRVSVICILSGVQCATRLMILDEAVQRC